MSSLILVLTVREAVDVGAVTVPAQEALVHCPHMRALSKNGTAAFRHSPSERNSSKAK
jgi:hypothetical protein